MRKKKKRSKKILFTFFIILALSSYGVIETLSAIILALRPTPPTRVTIAGGISYEAFKTNKLSSYPGSLSTDRYGFVHNGDKDRTIRDGDIFIFGGSTVEGRGSSSNNTTISSYLEKCVRKSSQDPTINVVNAGFSGDYSSQQYSRLSSSILVHFRPSIVIYLDGRNDAHYAVTEDFYPEFANTGLYKITNPLVGDRGNDTFFTNTLRVISRISRKMKNISGISSKISPMPDVVPMNLAERVSESAKNWKEISLKTVKLSERKGFRFYHFLQPTLALNKDAGDIEHFKRFFEKGHNRIDYLKVIREFYKSAQAISINGFVITILFSFTNPVWITK